jgi:hypothetical protein
LIDGCDVVRHIYQSPSPSIMPRPPFRETGWLLCMCNVAVRFHSLMDLQISFCATQDVQWNCTTSVIDSFAISK